MMDFFTITVKGESYNCANWGTGINGKKCYDIRGTKENGTLPAALFNYTRNGGYSRVFFYAADEKEARRKARYYILSENTCMK